MKFGRLYTVFFYAVAYLSNARGDQIGSTRSTSAWFTQRTDHEGGGLTDAQLRGIVSLTDKGLFEKALDTLLLPRVVGTEGHALVRQHIVKNMRDLQWTVEEDAFDDNTPLGRKTFTNVIATLDPTAHRRLVLACHYDSKFTPGEIFIGATDSSVPCAMMINLAQVLRNSLIFNKQQQQDLTLQLLFLDGEEAFKSWSDTDSLYGARNLAAKLENSPYPENNKDGTNQLNRIDLFVLLDLLGSEDVQFFSFFKNSENWYTRMLSFERRLSDLGLLNPRPFMFQQSARYNSGIADDHIPFLKRGIPILHVIPIPFPSVWHKLTDNAAALHYPSIENLNNILRAFVADYLHLVI